MLFGIHNLFVITNLLGDIYSSRLNYQHSYIKYQPLQETTILMNTTIPVGNGIEAIVSPEDYDRVTNMNKKWRMSSSGYPIYISRQNKIPKTVYMHKLIAGYPARHLNGNRLDNRRENLIMSRRNESSEFGLARLPNKDVIVHDWKDPVIVNFNDYAKIRYEDGRIYEGIVKDGIPNGFGQLSSSTIKMIGMWEKGIVSKGVHIEMREEEVESFNFIRDNKIVP